MTETTTATTDVQADEHAQALAQQQAEAQQLADEQAEEMLAEAKKELALVGKALKSGNRENAVSQYLAGLHGLRFLNLCRKAGKARSFATDELERSLSWWLGKSVDANLIIRTYAAIECLHGDLQAPASKAPAAEKKAWSDLVDSLPPVGHFHKAWSQLVDRHEQGGAESWVLLPGYEDKCKERYQSAMAKGLKLEDQNESGRVIEKGILTLTREHMVDYMRFKADCKAAEAAAKAKERAGVEEQAKELEGEADKQQQVVKSLLAQQAAAQTPEEKGKLEAAAKEAARLLEEHRKGMRTMIDRAAEIARAEKAASQEAADSEKRAEKGERKLDKRRAENTDAGRELPWQALGENAAQQASVKDLAEALYGIVAQHSEPEDVLYAMLLHHRKDASNAYKLALSQFGLAWERATSKGREVA